MTAKLDKMNLSEGGIVSSAGVLAYARLWDEQRFDSDSSTVQQSKAGHEKNTRQITFIRVPPYLSTRLKIRV